MCHVIIENHRNLLTRLSVGSLLPHLGCTCSQPICIPHAPVRSSGSGALCSLEG